MKLRVTIIWVCLLGVFATKTSDFDIHDPGYQNSILKIEQFKTPTSCKIIMTFDQQNPIAVYSPENFEESIDDSVYRVFMPRTTVDQEIETDLDLAQTEQGIELVLSGRLIKKHMGDKHIIFIFGN